jgi:hypothetical protein
MPATCQINREAGFIETHCTGELTFDDVMRHFQQLEAEPSLPERLDVLLDCRSGKLRMNRYKLHPLDPKAYPAALRCMERRSGQARHGCGEEEPISKRLKRGYSVGQRSFIRKIRIL